MSSESILEGDGGSTPIDRWIILLEPGHTEYNIVAIQLSRNKVQRGRIGANGQGHRGEYTSSFLLMTISKGNERRRSRIEGQAMLLNKRRGDKVARCPTIEQNDSGVRTDMTSELEKRLTGGSNIGDLVW